MKTSEPDRSNSPQMQALISKKDMHPQQIRHLDTMTPLGGAACMQANSSTKLILCNTVFVRIVAAAAINFSLACMRLLIEGDSYARAAFINLIICVHTICHF